MNAKSKKSPLAKHKQGAGFTLVEIMVSMTILMLVMGMTLSQFVISMRMLYRDAARAETNANLRRFTGTLTRQTIDASEFYLFPYHKALDGNVDLTADKAPLVVGTDDIYDANGDCLVLITKTTDQSPVMIRRIRIYYRETTDQATMNVEAPIRLYDTGESGTWGESASNTHPYSNIKAALDTINLSTNSKLAGSTEVYARTRGRKKSSSTDLYPIFSSSSPSQTSSSDATVTINVEFMNGSKASGTNLLSSSSFNYTISPRR